MECGIEYCCLGHTGHILCTCADTDQVCGIVERCQTAELLDILDNAVINKHCLIELLTAMYYAVSYCSYL